MGRSMSASDLAAEDAHTIGTLAVQLERRFAALMNGEATETLDLEHLRTLISVGARLFAVALDVSDEQPVPVNGSVSPTEAVALASALISAHDLNPFDLAVWHARGPVSERS